MPGSDPSGSDTELSERFLCPLSGLSGRLFFEFRFEYLGVDHGPAQIEIRGYSGRRLRFATHGLSSEPIEPCMIVAEAVRPVAGSPKTVSGAGCTVGIHRCSATCRLWALSSRRFRAEAASAGKKVVSLVSG